MGGGGLCKFGVRSWPEGGPLGFIGLDELVVGQGAVASLLEDDGTGVEGVDGLADSGALLLVELSVGSEGD
jgi:hypothetical protein